MQSRYYVIYALGVVLAVFLLWSYTERQLTDRKLDYQRLEIVSHSNHLAGRLSVEISSDLNLLNGLMAVISSDPDISDERFEHYAAEIMKTHERLINIALARDFVITKVYPPEPNRAVLGVDLRQLPDQARAVERMVESRDIVIAGPLHLVQGGVGIIGRIPVFLTQEDSGAGESKIWGFASLVVDYPGLLEDVEIATYERQMKIAIRGRDGLGAEGDVFYGDGALFRENAVITNVDIPNGAWQIAAIPAGGWAVRPDNVLIIRTGFVVLALFLLLVSYYFLQRAQYQKRLVQALADANEANAAKTRFLAMMSHDLRTPLNAILGFSDIIRKENTSSRGNEKHREYAELINRSGHQLLQSVNNILILARVERGSYPMKETEVDLPPLVRFIMRQCKQEADARGTKCSLRAEDGCPALLGDEEMIRRMVTNLLTNAIKFSDEGSTIIIECGQNKEGGIDLSVADTGEGMTEEEISIVCEPFVQLERIWSRREDGMGLGLAIVRSFAHFHGAVLDIQSTKGKGTVVTISFPPSRTVADMKA